MKIVSSIIQDTIEITNSKGETIKEIPFRINLSTTGNEIAKKRIELARTDTKDIEAVGHKFCELLEAVFGGEVLAELLDYYGDDYASLVTDVVPIFTDVVFPALDAQRERLVNSRKRFKH